MSPSEELQDQDQVQSQSQKSLQQRRLGPSPRLKDQRLRNVPVRRVALQRKHGPFEFVTHTTQIWHKTLIWQTDHNWTEIYQSTFRPGLVQVKVILSKPSCVWFCDRFVFVLNSFPPKFDFVTEFKWIPVERFPERVLYNSKILYIKKFPPFPTSSEYSQQELKLNTV